MALADLRTAATEKIDDGVHTVKRVIRQRANDIEDLRDAAALKVRRAPFQTMAMVAGAGLLMGFAMGLVRGRRRAPRIRQM